ncbi:helix-turn-helix transcriptional regulator [Cohnella suwonensis]|uniref:Helix-turn-helix transcriptional regulator n=1 Tax=Cohnella suwonensis TaxID=696072 RepID=A0ABW0LZX6_9BACL
MKADRLLKILMLLQNEGRLTLRELANRLEASERTIHRDMEALSAAGIPVYAERGSRGGWLLSEGYRSRMTGMTTGEIRSLLLLQASSVVKDLGLTESADEAMGKLLAALPATARQDADIARQRIHVDGAGWRNAPDTSLLGVAQKAVWEQRLLRISYRSRDAAGLSDRVVLPLGLVAKSRIWYMIAQAEPDGELRTFRISRLAGAELLDERFDRPEPFDLEAYWEQSTKRFVADLPRYPAKVRIAASRWDEFVREAYVNVTGQEERGRETDGRAGWVEANAEFHTEEHAQKVLLGYGRDARALAPESLRAGILEELTAAIAAMEDNPEEETAWIKE